MERRPLRAPSERRYIHGFQMNHVGNVLSQATRVFLAVRCKRRSVPVLTLFDTLEKDVK
jgi:hypothetical protein